MLKVQYAIFTQRIWSEYVVICYDILSFHIRVIVIISDWLMC